MSSAAHAGPPGWSASVPTVCVTRWPQRCAGVDTSAIALWLGHQSPVTTHIYLHADMTIKERALARIPEPNSTPGRYRPADDLINFLERL